MTAGAPQAIAHPGYQVEQLTAEGTQVGSIVARGSLLASFVAIGLAAGIVAPSTPTSATPALKYWEGTATKVVDGDTIWVNLKGDGTSRSFEVRNAGIQATEVAHPHAGQPKDECHSREAMARLSQLVLGKNRHVRLSASYASSQSNGRLLRYVDVDVNPDPAVDEWVDVQIVLLEEGYVLWKPERTESAHNGEYGLAAQRGLMTGQQLYNPNHRLGTCKPGPRQAMPLSIKINYSSFDPVKGSVVNREWIKIHNGGEKSVPLRGWRIRTATHIQYFRFPGWASIPPGKSVTVHSGNGSNAGRTFYWGSGVTLLPNPVAGAMYPGKGLYLVDPDGDVRATMIYPCLVSCSDPLQGKVAISKVVYDAPGRDADNINGEYVEIRPTIGRVNLAGYFFERLPYSKLLPKGTVLDPGDRLRVRMGPGKDDLKGTIKTVHLGVDHPILGNGGGSVSLRTDRAIRIDCYRWGNGTC